MNTLQENLKLKSTLVKELEEMKRRNRLSEEELENKISITEKELEFQLNENQVGKNTDNLFSQVKGTAQFMRPCLLLLKNEILEGNLPEILSDHENVSFWYNSGFRSGHARRITNNYGENNASERAIIRFASVLYDNPELLTDTVIKDILLFIDNALKSMETNSLWSEYIDKTISVKNKYYNFSKGFTGRVTSHLTEDNTGQKIRCYDFMSSVDVTLNDWNFNQYEIEVR